MTQTMNAKDASVNIWEAVVGITALVGLAGFVALLALKEWLREGFTPIETHTADIAALTTKIDRTERLTLGHGEIMSENRSQIEQAQRDIVTLRQFGSEPTRELIRAQRKIIRQLDQLTIHMGLEPVEDE